MIDIPLTASLALPFSDKYTTGPCCFGSSWANACHTLIDSSKHSSHQLVVLITGGDLMLLIFRKINKLNNLSQLIYITVDLFGGNTLENNKTKQLNKRRSRVTPFDIFLYCHQILWWWTSLPTSLLPIVKASHLKLITILLSCYKALTSSTFYYDFYTRYCNDIKY